MQKRAFDITINQLYNVHYLFSHIWSLINISLEKMLYKSVKEHIHAGIK